MASAAPSDAPAQDKTHSCSSCDLKFATPGRLKEHKRTVHQTSVRLQGLKCGDHVHDLTLLRDPGEPFTCPCCKATILTPKGIIKHLLGEKGGPPKCPNIQRCVLCLKQIFGIHCVHAQPPLYPCSVHTPPLQAARRRRQCRRRRRRRLDGHPHRLGCRRSSSTQARPQARHLDLLRAGMYCCHPMVLVFVYMGVYICVCACLLSVWFRPRPVAHPHFSI